MCSHLSYADAGTASHAKSTVSQLPQSFHSSRYSGIFIETNDKSFVTKISQDNSGPSKSLETLNDHRYHSGGARVAVRKQGKRIFRKRAIVQHWGLFPIIMMKCQDL